MPSDFAVLRLSPNSTASVFLTFPTRVLTGLTTRSTGALDDIARAQGPILRKHRSRTVIVERFEPGLLLWSGRHNSLEPGRDWHADKFIWIEPRSAYTYRLDGEKTPHSAEPTRPS